MPQSLYAKWMYDWEFALTTRDTNRIVRPLEWGFDWLKDFSQLASAASQSDVRGQIANTSALEQMVAVNQDIVDRAEIFFGYETPKDFRLETRHPQLFPTNVRPETLAQDAELSERLAPANWKRQNFYALPRQFEPATQKMMWLTHAGILRLLRSKSASPNRRSSLCRNGMRMLLVIMLFALFLIASESPRFGSQSLTTTFDGPLNWSGQTMPSAQISAERRKPAGRPW